MLVASRRRLWRTLSAASQVVQAGGGAGQAAGVGGVCDWRGSQAAQHRRRASGPGGSGLDREWRGSPWSGVPHSLTPSWRDSHSHARRHYSPGDASREKAAATPGGASQGAVPDSIGPRAGATPPATWVDAFAPPWAAPYLKLARLDAPAGTWLLLWPCVWSISLAAPPGALPDASLVALFTCGALLLRGAGCTVNDMWDADLDGSVERTKGRPLPSGAVTQAQALAFLGAQLGCGLLVLLQLNDLSRLVGASSLGLVFTYPLMKRITYWPQLFLGLTFNWGALLGWAAATGSLDWRVVAPLYGAGICWTLVYDTIYAHQDAADDARVGIRSTALRFGEATPQWLSGFSVAMLCGLATAGHAAQLGDTFLLGLAGTGAHLAWQVGTLDMRSGADCASKFKSNVHLGGLVAASIITGKLTAGC